MSRYRVTINGRDKQAMVDLVDKHGIAVFGNRGRFVQGTGYTVGALAGPDQIEMLRRNGYTVTRHEDAAHVAQLRHREAGRGNRYTHPTQASFNGYLNVAEVETAVRKAAAPPYSAFAQLITLPEKTCELRQSHALKIGSGNGADRIGVYFLGGVHAREWGSCDILINFIERLLQAYLEGSAIIIGPATFSAAAIKSIVDTLDLVIFPQANPDGRQFSMSGPDNVDWRKNRSRPPSRAPGCFGVDIDRNFDFMWQFDKYFAKDSGNLTSSNPGTEFYCGESAFSEPETRNARWIADQFGNIRFFMDVHSYGPNVLYRWGDADNQTIDPDMRFTNPYYDGARGINNADYKEYITTGDLADSHSLAVAVSEAIKAVRGTPYEAEPAVSMYPTSGASDDYFYSRHLTDPAMPKILSFMLEWGDVNTGFHPPYREMPAIIDEVIAGLLTFCLAIVARTPHAVNAG